MKRCWPILTWLLAAACADDSGGEDLCAEAPVVTWANFGEGFMLENCQSCHAESAVDRHDAPVGVAFDTPEDIARWAERILARAAGDAPTMPPGGGTVADDREMLRIWLECYP